MRTLENLAAPAEQPVTETAPRSARGIAMSTIIFIIAATALGIIGQVMLKHGMTQMGPINLSGQNALSVVWSIATSPFVVGGLLIYGIGTFFWLITLSRIDLSMAYPFVSLNQVILVLVAWLFLGEKIGPMRALGVAIICVGMLFIARS